MQRSLVQAFVVTTALAAFTGLAHAHSGPKPKYGPEATVLSASHVYIQKNVAPDYWALSPYYAAQQDDRSCSVASVTMVVNAARVGMKLTADEELATQKALLKKVDDGAWKSGVGEGGKGVTLEQLGSLVKKSLAAYGIEASVEVRHAEDSRLFAQLLRKTLLENEKSAKDFIIANFLQGVYTGDAEVGHIAPIAAYDAKNRRVLVMDPDRQWYEPYWVSESTFLKGMATSDQVSGKSRGFVWVKIVR